MKKIPSVFVREDADRGKASLVTAVVTPGCEWVIANEGVATRKWDGTAVLVRSDNTRPHLPWVWKRYDAKHGKKPPAAFVPAQDPDPKTGHWPGWLPCELGNPADKWIIEAFTNALDDAAVVDLATYEACGPKIGGNAERLDRHMFFRHGGVHYSQLSLVPDGGPLTFDAIRSFLATHPSGIEGLVWHHPDGRMAKIKSRDFGLPWPRSSTYCARCNADHLSRVCPYRHDLVR